MVLYSALLLDPSVVGLSNTGFSVRTDIGKTKKGEEGIKERVPKSRSFVRFYRIVEGVLYFWCRLIPSCT